MSEVIEIWKIIEGSLLNSMEEGGHSDRIWLHFLDERIDVASDGFSGEDRLYYYSRDDHKFYTYLDHWDGGNMFAGWSTEPTSISIQHILEILERKKQLAIRKIAPEDERELEDIYNHIVRLLLSLEK